LQSASFYNTLAIFAAVFTVPTFNNFVMIAVGWVLCRDRHTVSQALRVGIAMGFPGHHSVLYRFFGRASWATDEIGRAMFGLALRFIPGLIIIVPVDDTLCRKTGPHIWGGGMHHDALASSYGRNTSKQRHVAFAFGHNWVVLSVWVPLPWAPIKGVAIPILFRLYRSKKLTAKPDYHKRTELAVEMLEVLREWVLDAGRTVMVVGDSEYSCKTLVKRLPQGFEFSGPVVMNAALFGFPEPPVKGRRGAPRKKGVALPSPKQMIADQSIPWKTVKVTIYGSEVSILVKSVVCLWYRVSGSRHVRVVVTRDPNGRFEDRAYFSTLEGAGIEDVLTWFSRRWSLEVTFFNAKQFLGLEQPQNGWGRQPRNPLEKKRAGPQPRGAKGRSAAERTVPTILYLLGAIYLWYFEYGHPATDVAIARALAPWYLQKTEPAFADMLAALRRDLFKIGDFSMHPVENWVMREFQGSPANPMQVMSAC
jgi:hypothetical protein